LESPVLFCWAFLSGTPPRGREPKRGVGENFPHFFGVTATNEVRSAIGAEPLWGGRAKARTTGSRAEGPESSRGSLNWKAQRYFAGLFCRELPREDENLSAPLLIIGRAGFERPSWLLHVCEGVPDCQRQSGAERQAAGSPMVPTGPSHSDISC
jgi:hypothetical protein